MKRQTRSSRFETLHHNRDSILSLNPLHKVLTQAQKDLPPRLAPLQEEIHDEMALQLIANVKRQFKCSTPAHWIGSSLQFGPEETAGLDG